jgi:hypothetical protein
LNANNWMTVTSKNKIYWRLTLSQSLDKNKIQKIYFWLFNDSQKSWRFLLELYLTVCLP